MCRDVSVLWIKSFVKYFLDIIDIKFHLMLIQISCDLIVIYLFLFNSFG